jgi:hypothetical protein
MKRELSEQARADTDNRARPRPWWQAQSIDLGSARQPPMRWHHLAPGRGVLELPGPDRLELELMLWWGGGLPSRAAWLWSQTGRVAVWAAVGEA